MQPQAAVRIIGDRLDKTPADHLALTYHGRRNTMRYRDLSARSCKLDRSSSTESNAS